MSRRGTYQRIQSMQYNAVDSYDYKLHIIIITGYLITICYVCNSKIMVLSELT